MQVKTGKELTISEVLNKQGQKVIVKHLGQEQVFRVVEGALADDFGTYRLQNFVEAKGCKFYECFEEGKFRICINSWSFGTFEDQSMAESVAKIALMNGNYKEVFVKDAGNDETIKVITMEDVKNGTL